MPIDLQRLVSDINPNKTVLFFGAGASIPSKAPSVQEILSTFESAFQISHQGYSLREYTGILENKFGRSALIQELRKLFQNVKPTGSLLNLPLYDWKSLFTTNYDTLIEDCYKKAHKQLEVFSSNFDFSSETVLGATKLFKLHGTLEKDICDGHKSRMILTDSDYDHTQDFREGLYDRFKSDLYGANLIIIGHSLADEDIKLVANKAATISLQTEGVGKVILLMYSKDEARAELWEQRGFKVCFGSLDDLFSKLSSTLPNTTLVYKDSDNTLDHFPVLRPVTLEVSHEIESPPNAMSIFNGRAGSYSDVQFGLTFQRVLTNTILDSLKDDSKFCSVVLGASGVGKTTLARQIILELMEHKFECWEHKDDHQFPHEQWFHLAQRLKSKNQFGALLVDEAHSHLHEINFLVESLYSSHIFNLKILLISSKNHWNPRIKSPAIYKGGEEFYLGKLKNEEIDSLINLIDSVKEFKPLIEQSFSGFSKYEKRRRLIDRCEQETFVCLKNIFCSEKFDDIILREYANLKQEHQEIYKIVAAMESSGIRVHRQLIIRLLGINAAHINEALMNLTDIIHEYDITPKEGIYGWKGRHSVIVSLLTKYKYPDNSLFIELFDRVIDAISPTYSIEIRTIRELCNIESGLPRISDKSIQNRLLRKMMSIAPGERVPRHRLIRNLIEMGEFEKAESEIRIFETDFGRDAPITRYKINILIGRALNSPGILEEDRVAILFQARDSARSAISKYPDNKLILSAYCEVGVQIYKKTNDYSIFDDAMKEIKKAESRIGDPDISAIINRYERIISGQATHTIETNKVILEIDSEASIDD